MGPRDEHEEEGDLRERGRGQKGEGEKEAKETKRRGRKEGK